MVFLITISAMGKKSMILGLALFLALSSFHEVSCKPVEGRDEQKFQCKVTAGGKESEQHQDEDDSTPNFFLYDITKVSSLAMNNFSGIGPSSNNLTAEWLIQIVEEHKKQKLLTVEQAKVVLKSYRNSKVHDLLARSDFEEILTLAARYEELSSAPVRYISRLSVYLNILKEANKASKRIEVLQRFIKVLKAKAMEKQKTLDYELELAKVSAKKEDVDMNIKKIVKKLSQVILEASEVYEEYHMILKKLKEEQASRNYYINDAMENTEHIWGQFLATL